MGVRRRSRELAVQILFQEEYHSDLNLEQSVALYRESFDTSPEVWEYAKLLVQGIKAKKAEVDTIIQSYSSNWRLDRMSHVDRNILRVACFELRFLDREVPSNVVINEAIEIGKKFSTEDSASFLNAILDNMAKAT
ncbi:MAG: transcription antitermination factor NusB [Bdellovibrionales bacterium]|nr:transcription antitermination factor NusB [Bdellovibrionales bacterium]